MKIAMIHEINDDILKADYSNFDILTFDDGLYTQYKYHEHFAKFNKRMIYFIISGFICDKTQNTEYITCVDAQKKAKNNDFSNYMTLEQIKELSNLYEIGGHSHKHLLINNNDLDLIKTEVDNCLMFLNDNNIKINSYCLPFNQSNKIYEIYLKSKKLEVFGKGRICIEEYLNLKPAWVN